MCPILTLKAQRYPMYIVIVFLSPKFRSVSLEYKVRGNPCVYYWYARVPNFAQFHSTTSLFSSYTVSSYFFRVPNDPKMTLNTARSKIPHIWVPRSPSPKFQSLSLYNQPLSRYCTFYNSTFDYYVKPVKEEQKFTKNLKFHNSFNNFDTWIFESEYVVYFLSFKIFPPIWSHVNVKEKS